MRVNFVFLCSITVKLFPYPPGPIGLVNLITAKACGASKVAVTGQSPFNVFSFLSSLSYLLIQTGRQSRYAADLVCSITTGTLRFTSEYSFTDHGKMESSFGCGFVVSGSIRRDLNAHE